jgi:predicted enzyme related to lactoylglutathione lyase
MTTTLSFAALTIDSADPASLADFWGQALSRPVSSGAIAGDTAIDQTGPESGPRIILHQPEGGTDKNAIHPVLMTDRYDEEIDRLTALGAQVVRELNVPVSALPPGAAEVRQATLADPDGNEFELVLWRQAG